MPVGGIKGCGIFALGCETIDETFLRVVGIVSQHGAADNILTLSAVIPKTTADKAAFVLGTVTVGF